MFFPNNREGVCLFFEIKKMNEDEKSRYEEMCEEFRCKIMDEFGIQVVVSKKKSSPQNNGFSVLIHSLSIHRDSFEPSNMPDLSVHSKKELEKEINELKNTNCVRLSLFKSVLISRLHLKGGDVGKHFKDSREKSNYLSCGMFMDRVSDELFGYPFGYGVSVYFDLSVGTIARLISSMKLKRKGVLGNELFNEFIKKLENNNLVQEVRSNISEEMERPEGEGPTRSDSPSY